MSFENTLWYFADPMCSWCWGFSPVMEQVRQAYHDKLNIAFMLGGLRPGTHEPLSASMREDILHHWQEVEKMTGQTFNFEHALPEGFVYDTEPASRAVICIAQLKPDNIFPYFTQIQSAFYIEHVDVTQKENLAHLAKQQQVTEDEFLALFEQDSMKQKTFQHFQAARQAGVTGFPSLVIQKESDFEFITRGYQHFAPVSAAIEAWLNKA